MILSISSFALAVGLYAISQLIMHSKIRFKGSRWEVSSWKNKYKWGSFLPEYAPDNWYYRLIKAEYKERWFTSTWLTVAFTDWYHFCQLLFIILFSISAVSYSTIVNRPVDGLIYWGIWHIVFAITYYSLQRKKK